MYSTPWPVPPAIAQSAKRAMPLRGARALSARLPHALSPSATQGAAPWPVQQPRTRIVFVVMSAVAQAQTVDQLARALAPHPVLVHHDFSQQRDFALSARNAQFVPDAVRMGWARFGFVQGIFHTLQHAVQTLDFDYLQLLSPSCLPIAPLADFERHISGPQEAHFDALDLQADADVRRSVGYRAWTTENSLAHRAMRRLCTVCFGDAPERRDEAGVWVHSGRASGVQAALAALALDSLTLPGVGRKLRGPELRLYYGSTWFGARVHLIDGMLHLWHQPGVQDYFARVRIAEEFLIPSLLMALKPHKGPMNHLIQRFDQAHPGCFAQADLARLRRSGAFFARKFPDDARAPVRQRVLHELVLQPPRRLWPARAVQTLA